MKYVVNLFVVLFFLFQAIGCGVSSESKSADAENAYSGFNIQRGVNLSHWLSQTDRIGDERASFMSEKDFKKIAGFGYDNVRLPIDEVHLWNEEGEKDTAAFELVHKAIKWSKENGLRIIADLHVVRSHYFNADVRPLWNDPEAQDEFVDMWMQISDELSNYPNDLLAYELLNEAVADDSDDWNKLIAKTMKALRKKEPNRMVVIGSNRWQSVNKFDELQIPENDSCIILSFHFYSPHVFTHYQAPWSSKVGFYKGPVHYPGHPIHEEDLAPYDSAQIKSLTADDAFYNREYIQERIQEPIEFAKKRGLQLYCGEFGCYPTTPLEDRVQWYSDVTAVFEKNDIAWANWDYKGGFGVVDGETGEPRIKILNALTGYKEKDN
jgi:endoglucanase